MTITTKPDDTGTPVAFPHPKISLIEQGLQPHDFSLFIGGTQAARDIRLLRENNIAVVINCAVNLDINYVMDPTETAEGEKCAHGTGPVRVFKLGMVDGPGNTETMILAGYFMLDGAMRQELPDKPSYPRRDRGNVLVHCRGGRSRSTALVALYLHVQCPDRFASLEAAIQHVREKRKLHPDEWYSAPKQMLIDAAQKAADVLNRMNL